MKTLLKITKREILENMNKVISEDGQLYKTWNTNKYISDLTEDIKESIDSQHDLNYGFEPGDNYTDSIMIFVANGEIIKTEEHLNLAINEGIDIKALEIIVKTMTGNVYGHYMTLRGHINTMHEVEITKEKENSRKFEGELISIHNREWSNTHKKRVEEVIYKEKILQEKLRKFNEGVDSIVNSVNEAFEYYSDNEKGYLTDGRTDGFYLRDVDRSASRYEIAIRTINYEIFMPRDIKEYDSKERLSERGYTLQDRKKIWTYQMNIMQGNLKVRTIREVFPEEDYKELVNKVNRALDKSHTSNNEIDVLYSIKRLKQQGLDIINKIKTLRTSTEAKEEIENTDLKEGTEFRDRVYSFEYENELRKNKRNILRLI